MNPNLSTILAVFASCILLCEVHCTLSPSNKSKKGAKPAKEKDFKIKVGAQQYSVFDRNLIEDEPSAKDILVESGSYYKDTENRLFNGTVLGYVTSVCVVCLSVLNSVFTICHEKEKGLQIECVHYHLLAASFQNRGVSSIKILENFCFQLKVICIAIHFSILSTERKRNITITLSCSERCICSCCSGTITATMWQKFGDRNLILFHQFGYKLFVSRMATIK